MKRSSMAAMFLLGALALGIGFTATPPVTSQDSRLVHVTNFPEVQRIDGKVEIDEPIRLSELTVIREILVPPVNSQQTTRWVDAGLVQTGGFPNVVLSLHGEVKGELTRGGEIVAVLIPDEQSVNAAFDEEGLVHFGLTVGAIGPRSGLAYFASDQPRYTVGFNAYRVFLYNETDKTVTANLFAYLTN